MDAQKSTQVGGPKLDQQRAKQQFHMFQEALPKVNNLAFTALINEIIPMAMAVENIKNDDSKKNLKNNHKEEEKSIVTEDNVNEISEKLQDGLNFNENIVKGIPSHLLIQQLYKSEPEERKRVMDRIRNMGFQIGCNLTELLVFSNNPSLNFRDMDLLAIMKFICRDVWKQLFEKQIDNLKTNHRGTFYLLDHEYLPIQEFHIDSDDKASLDILEQMVLPFLEIPIGIIRGVLDSFGYEEEVVDCKVSFVDRPHDKDKGIFPKSISFHVTVEMKTTNN